MHNVLRVLIVVLATQSVGCAMLVGSPPQTAIHDDQITLQSSAAKQSYDANAQTSNFSPIVARSTANNSSLGAKATEVVEAERAAKLEARRQRDQRFAEVQKEVSAQLQQRQTTPIVTEAFPAPSLPADSMASSEPLHREVKKRLYLDEAQFQPIASTTVSPIAVTPQPWQSIHAKPLAIITMVVLAISGVTWPLTRSQRLAFLFARFHRSDDSLDTKAVAQEAKAVESIETNSHADASCNSPDVEPGREVQSSLNIANECPAKDSTPASSIAYSNLEAVTCFRSCDPLAEDKQAWLSELQEASTDFMVVCVASWTKEDLVGTSVQPSSNSNTESEVVCVVEAESELEAEATTTFKTTPTNMDQPMAVEAESSAVVRVSATQCRALIPVNQRIVIGQPPVHSAPAEETAESNATRFAGSPAEEMVEVNTAIASIIAKPQQRGVSLMGLPAKGPAKPVFPKLMPPARTSKEILQDSEPSTQGASQMLQQQDCVQDGEEVGSTHKFVGFVVLFAEDGTIGSFQKLMIVDSFQLKDKSEFTANVVQVA